jgi:hypothetical protein
MSGHDFETELKIIADFEAGNRSAVRNVEADLSCYMEILAHMKNPRNHPTLSRL